MKYKVRFNYHLEVEVEADNTSEYDVYRMADRLCPDPWETPERFCEEIVYDDWTYEEVE